VSWDPVNPAAKGSEAELADSSSQAVTVSAMYNGSSHPQILEGRCYRGVG